MPSRIQRREADLQREVNGRGADGPLAGIGWAVSSAPSVAPLRCGGCGSDLAGSFFLYNAKRQLASACSGGCARQIEWEARYGR